MINAKHVEVRINGVTHSQSQFYYHKISTQNQGYAFTISDEGVLLPQNTLKYTKVGHSHSQMKKFYYHKTRRSTRKLGHKNMSKYTNMGPQKQPSKYTKMGYSHSLMKEFYYNKIRPSTHKG